MKIIVVGGGVDWMASGEKIKVPGEKVERKLMLIYGYTFCILEILF